MELVIKKNDNKGKSGTPYIIPHQQWPPVCVYLAAEGDESILAVPHLKG